jgi:hypothetical protein
MVEPLVVPLPRNSRHGRITLTPAISTTAAAHAKTAEGHELPVIDVTHPRFALADDPKAISALFDTYVEAERRQARVPAFVTRWMMRLAARRSLLLRALLRPNTGFLDGLTTYVMKLGPGNLPPPFDGDIDRRLAAAPHSVAMRLRLQQTAKLMAEGLEHDLIAAPGVPLHLFNIAGGPAIDSLNALILLRRAGSDLLARQITIQVLDVDARGPLFGANALAALSADGGALAGVEVALSHETYDWNRPAKLDELVGQAAARGAIVAASSEGGLFEYGSDQAIVANLRALHAAGRGARLVAGSVTRADGIRRRSIAACGFKLVPRGVDGFAPLAQRGGFRVDRVEVTPLSDQLRLRPV